LLSIRARADFLEKSALAFCAPSKWPQFRIFKKKTMRIFLGGTCSTSKWRDELIPHLEMDYFNPVVDTWTEAAYQRELVERATCDLLLYVLTPLAAGYYSIAEVVDDSNKRPNRTIFCLLEEDQSQHFTPSQFKSLKKVGQMVAANGATFLQGLPALIQYMDSLQRREANA
jgi:hypothetical protein